MKVVIKNNNEFYADNGRARMEFTSDVEMAWDFGTIKTAELFLTNHEDYKIMFGATIELI